MTGSPGWVVAVGGGHRPETATTPVIDGDDRGCRARSGGFGSGEPLSLRARSRVRRSEVGAAHRPRAGALARENVLGDADLLFAAGVAGVAGAAVGLPGALRELQAAVVAVTGVDGPVAAALALRDSVPVVRRGGGRGETERDGGEGAGSGDEGGDAGADLSVLRHEKFPRCAHRLGCVAGVPVPSGCRGLSNRGTGSVGVRRFERRTRLGRSGRVRP